jgi:hypothetical protein
MTEERPTDDSQATGETPQLPQRREEPRTMYPPRADGTAFPTASRPDPKLLSRLVAGVQNIPAEAPAPTVPAHHALVAQALELLAERPKGYAELVQGLISRITEANAPAYDKITALRGLIPSALKAAHSDGDPQSLVNIRLASASLKIGLLDGRVLAEEEFTRIDELLQTFPGDVDTHAQLDEQVHAARQQIFGGSGSN